MEVICLLFAGFYKYVKSVLLANSCNTPTVSPVSVGNFSVRPVVGPVGDETTVLDTFQVTPNSRPFRRSSSQSFASKTFSVTSSEEWLRVVRENIQQEISK